MEYVNLPAAFPENMSHHTFFSKVLNHELGYNIYLPPNAADRKWPVVYHLHGWTGSESSEIWAMEKVCRSRQAIMVFPNNSPMIEDQGNLPVEEMLFQEFIPLIESLWPTLTDREHRSVSGFSMGGGMAFYYAVKYPELFSGVTAYAGTYHHYFHRDYPTVGAAPQQAPALYRAMMEEGKFFDKNILDLLSRNADQLRNRTQISLHIGTDDVLYCDNEIVHFHMNSLRLPHEYRVYNGAGHSLAAIL